MWSPQSYLRHTILSTQWTLCTSVRKKMKVHFLFIHILENTCFVHNSMGNGPVEGAVFSFLKHEKGYYSKTHPKIFLIFAESVALLPKDIINLIPLGPQTQSIKVHFPNVIIRGCFNPSLKLNSAVFRCTRNTFHIDIDLNRCNLGMHINWDL